MTLVAVTFQNLITVAVAAAVAGVGVTAVFSLALLGATRRTEARREGRPSAGWTLLAITGAVAFTAAVAAGIYAVAGL